MSDARHHHVILVPVPVPMEIGSPKTVRQTKPTYDRQDRPAHWRPARDIPQRRGKAEALRQFLERMARQESDIRAFMRPDPAAMRAWLTRGRVLAA